MERDKELSVQIQTRLIEQVSAYEGRYRRLVDNLHDIVMELDSEGRISFVNRMWSERLKYPVESAQRQLLGSFMPGADARQLNELLARTSPDGGLEHRMDVVLLDARGHPQEFELSLRRGHSGGWLGLFRGNAERRAAEAQLREINLLLQEAARLKDNFMATMSHELRTPLNAMLALCECLTEEVYGPLSPPQSQAIRSVEQNGVHLLHLINDILDLSRIEAGMMRVASDCVDLPPLVRECASMVQPLADRKRQRIGVHMPEDALLISADRSRLRQVLLNLLGNACKFTPVGGSVSLTSQRQATRQLLTVADDGIGIAPQAEKLLFQSFVQVDSGLNREKQEGSGLGLVLALRMMDLMGGSISYSTCPGKGTHFTLALPAFEGNAAQSGWQARLAALQSPLLIVAPAPVLIPADSALVAWVTDVASAKRELAQRRFCAVLLHPRLGTGSVQDTVSRFRQEADPGGTPLLVLCSLLSIHHCRELHSAGADGCLLQPLDPGELLGWLEALPRA